MASPSTHAAIQPPPGVIPDFDDPPSLSKWNTVCVAVCLSITSTLFIARCYVRLRIKREWVLEDYMCCAAWWFNIASIVYAPAILSTKLAILLLYRRVFSPHRRGTFDRSIRLFILILCLFYLATTLVKIWECTPRERIWNRSVEGTCINIPALLDASGICNTLTDLIILFMPIQAVWNLKTTTRRKIGVVLVFSVGFIAPAFSLVGVVVRFKTSKSQDTTWNQPSILLWGTAEVSTGLICVCIPALAILTHRRTPPRPSPPVFKGSESVGSRYAKLSARLTKQTMTDDEVNLFDKGDLLELQQQGTIGTADGTGGVSVPVPAVVTGIVGGEGQGFKGSDTRVEDGEGRALPRQEQAVGIVRTVRMEQTYL